MNFFLILFIFGCAESSLLCGLLSSCGEWDTVHCSARASHLIASLVGYSGCGVRVRWLQLPQAQ